MYVRLLVGRRSYLVFTGKTACSIGKLNYAWFIFVDFKNSIEIFKELILKVGII